MDARNIAVSVPRLSNGSLADSIAQAKALGFSAITFGGVPSADTSSLSFFWDDLDEERRAALLAVREQFERAVIHAPFVDLPLVSANTYIERESLRQILGSVRAAGALQLEVVTVHTGLRHDNIPTDEFMRRLVTNLRTLGDAAAEHGTMIGVENWRFPADPDEHDALLQAVDHPAVAATVDLGHIAYWYKRDGINRLADETAVAEYNARLLSLIDRLGERVIHVHAHDVLPADISDHNPVGSGIIDFEAVVDKLEQIGFNGLLMLEVKDDGSSYESVVSNSRARLLQAMNTAVAV